MAFEQNAGDRRFWFTHFASRNRRIVHSFDVFHQIINAINQASENPDSWSDHLVESADAESALVNVAGQLGAEVRRPQFLKVIISLSARRAKAIARLAIRVKQLASAIRRAAKLPRITLPNAPTCIFTLTYSDQRRLDPSLPYHKDLYFGDLDKWLGETGQELVFLANCAQREVPIVQHFANNSVLLGRCNLTLMHSRLTDVGKAFVSTTCFQPRVKHAVYRGVDFSFLFIRDLKDERHTIFSNEITYRAVLRFLCSHQTIRQAMICYENNSWERAVFCATRKLGLPIVGYLHCAVLKGSLNNYCSEFEWKTRPRPDHIVTTGPDARGLLLPLGAYPGEIIHEGMALRDPPVLECNSIRDPVPNRILVLLEGLFSMAALLALCQTAALRRPDLEFVVRSHGDLPAPLIAAHAGFSFEQSPLRNSNTADLRNDVMAAAVVVYQGTAAAFTAGLMPRPLIRTALDPRVDDDPLTGIEDGKWEVQSIEEFLRAIDEAMAVDQAELRKATARRRTSILRRWAPPDPNHLSVFRLQENMTGDEVQTETSKVH